MAFWGKEFRDPEINAYLQDFIREQKKMDWVRDNISRWEKQGIGKAEKNEVIRLWNFFEPMVELLHKRESQEKNADKKEEISRLLVHFDAALRALTTYMHKLNLLKRTMFGLGRLVPVSDVVETTSEDKARTARTKEELTDPLVIAAMQKKNDLMKKVGQITSQFMRWRRPSEQSRDQKGFADFIGLCRSVIKELNDNMNYIKGLEGMDNLADQHRHQLRDIRKFMMNARENVFNMGQELHLELE